MSENNGNELLKPLIQLLQQEPSRLAEARKNGKKVIGYFGPYVPEELILAAGMLPLHLVIGGDPEAVESGNEFLKPTSCPYARSSVGFKQIGTNPFFNAVDAVCVSLMCDSMKRVQEYWDQYFGLPSRALGVPQTHDRLRTKPQAFDYFKNELLSLRAWLGKIAGREIKDRDIDHAIASCNEIRENLWSLFEYPVDGRSPIVWRDALRITNAGFLLDRNEFNSELSRISAALRHKKLESIPYDERARLMVCGSILANGDNKLLDIVEKAGGNIVADSTCTGSMSARKKVKMPGVTGNPMDVLTERYLYNFPCPFMTDLQIRVNNVTKLARDYQAHGLIYYALRYCDTWRADYKYIQDELYKELSVPTLLIETDYTRDDTDEIKEKVEAFIKRIEGR